jgi:hypothetical protein
MCASRGPLAKLNYMDIKQILDRKVTENKPGTLTNGEYNFWSKRSMIIDRTTNLI